MTAKLSEATQSGAPVDMVKMYNFTTLDIMADLSFNESLGLLETGKILGMGRGRLPDVFLIKQIILRIPSVQAKFWEQFNYAAERVDRRLERQPERPDLWSKVIGNPTLSLDEHYSNASLFMIAGSETTATALSGITYWLLRSPALMDKLKTEIRTTFCDAGEINLDSIARLEYLNAVIYEGLRMYRPVPFLMPRIVPKGGIVICGRFVPAGPTVGVHSFATYRSPTNFEKPDTFCPERWLGDAGRKNRDLQAVEPFSIGPRSCIGRNLAWHELRLILVMVLLRFDLALCKESQKW
ncbi:Putative cytochrome P450 [Septoria linicola]|uniref:Cytochrome P450 n=1 Tax=Septoria linicola TaxID=215465 RepID=A0A9Q9AYQ9_9PEZI|nr:Putative cytochrome P450 [Septoria linicola]